MDRRVAGLGFLSRHIVERISKLHHDHVGVIPWVGTWLPEEFLEDRFVVLVVDHEVPAEIRDGELDNSGPFGVFYVNVKSWGSGGVRYSNNLMNNHND